MGALDGKTALVTGGSSGIGRAAAVRLAAEGAHVLVTGRRQEQLDRVASEIGTATAVAADVSVAADVDRLYDAVRERGRGLDVLFANAGVNHLATLEETTEEDHDRIFDVNVKGLLLTVRGALGLLNEGASVIVTGSTASVERSASNGTYSAAKAAVTAYATAWAKELGPRGIRVNVLTPGPVDTAMFDDVFAERADEMKAVIGGGLPAGRIGRPDELAAAVAFLASAQSSFVYGADLVVAGGTA